MTTTRLHFVVPGPLDQRTGGYRYDTRIVQELVDLGWQVIVNSLAGTFPAGDAEAQSSLADTLAALPDGARVVIDGLAMGGMPGPLSAHEDRLRIVGLVHHPLADETGLSSAERLALERSERMALARCVGILVTSEFTARRLARYGVPPDRIRAVSPGTDPSPRAQGPGPGEPTALLCVGSVTPRKGQDVLVRALEEVRELAWTCTCAGSLTRDPGYAAEVQSLAARARLSGRIRFTGECDERALHALYDRSSLFVLPSHFEGYGMALAEALARGLPIVSTTGGAIPETVVADAAILVEPGDVDALAGALRSLLSDVADSPGCREAPSGAPRLEAMRAAARDAAAALPSWGQAGRAFARALEELAPSVRRGPA